MSSTELVHVLAPEQRRLLALFVREYELLRDHAVQVQVQAQSAVRQATEARDAAYQRLLRAAALALGGADLTVDFVTWEVFPRARDPERLDDCVREGGVSD
jgi:hypothetical protein